MPKNDPVAPDGATTKENTMNDRTATPSTHPFRTPGERRAWRITLAALVLAAVIMLGAWN